MSFLQADICPNSLGLNTSVNIILPGNAAEVNGVLYLLHGLSDDHSMWSRRTSVERYADAYRMAVVMPTTHRAFYTDTKYGMRYWTYISEELPQIIGAMFRLPTEREKTFAAGLSMGGYGALKLGLKCPGKFAAVGAFSSVADIAEWHANSDEAHHIFGDAVAPEENLFDLASGFEGKTETAPRIYMWCGESDFLLQPNRRLKAHFEKVGLNFEYHESEGSHEWARWDEQIARFIPWALNKQS